MPLSLTISVEPTEEPVTTDEAKAHSRITTTAENPVIDGLIKAARLYVEAYTKRKLVSQTWLLKFDRFPAREIIVPLPPLSSVTSVAYTDQNGNAQTWSSALYQKDLTSEPGRIKPIESESFPDTQRSTYNTVVVTFVAGYGDASAVPERFKHAIKAIVEHWYEYRGRVSERALRDVPLSIDAMLMQDRMWSF